MPRIARKYNDSCFYHAIVQGFNKEFIFDTDIKMEKYKKIVIEKLKDNNITILAYCIMINHAHFLIYSEKSDYLSKFMQKVNTTYSNYYNKSKDRVGYVFRDRFYSQSITNQKQLFNCLRYIHNNPVKANICKNMEDYKYSSYNEFFNEKNIISSKSIELLFGSTTNFKEIFSSVHKKQSQDEYEKEFYDIKEMDISEYINTFEKQNEIKIERIKNNKRLLKAFIIGARKLTDVKIVELSNIIGVGKNTVSKYLKSQ